MTAPAKRKKSRRARGTGSCRFDARRGLWVGRVPVGRYPNGKLKYNEVTAATQAEVLRKMAGVGPPPPTATVAELASRWLADHGGKPGTRAQYASCLRAWILPAIGHLKLADVTPTKVEALAAKMHHAGRSPATVTLALACLRAMLGGAVRDGVLARNPVSVARKPKKVKKKIDPFTAAELRAVVVAAAGGGDPRAVPLALMAAVGCRVGEAAALDVTDFDAAAGAVSITKTTGVHGTGPPKSANGVRRVAVPRHALPALVAAAAGRKAGPLFRGDDRSRVRPQQVRDAWYQLLARLGLRRRNPHQLRHSVVSHAVSAGVPLGNVARDAGDAVETIVKTYLHPVEGASVAAAMERLFDAVE